MFKDIPKIKIGKKQVIIGILVSLVFASFVFNAIFGFGKFFSRQYEKGVLDGRNLLVQEQINSAVQNGRVILPVRVQQEDGSVVSRQIVLVPFVQNETAQETD